MYYEEYILPDTTNHRKEEIIGEILTEIGEDRFCNRVEDAGVTTYTQVTENEARKIIRKNFNTRTARLNRAQAALAQGRARPQARGRPQGRHQPQARTARQQPEPVERDAANIMEDEAECNRREARPIEQKRASGGHNMMNNEPVPRDPNNNIVHEEQDSSHGARDIDVLSHGFSDMVVSACDLEDINFTPDIFDSRPPVDEIVTKRLSKEEIAQFEKELLDDPLIEEFAQDHASEGVAVESRPRDSAMHETMHEFDIDDGATVNYNCRDFH